MGTTGMATVTAVARALVDIIDGVIDGVIMVPGITVVMANRDLAPKVMVRRTAPRGV